MAAIPHICVIGSLNIDFVTFTPRCPGPGETLTATSSSVNAGGKGANQAVACGRASFVAESQQDVSVSMIGAVGAADPYFSTLMKPALEESGVSSLHVKEMRDAQTGCATIIVEEAEGGENRILVVPGANHAGMDDAERILASVRDFKNLPEVVVMQGEIPRQTVLALLRYFNRPDSTTQVIFNPAPVYPEGIPLSALENMAVLIVNETEAVQITQSIAEIPTLQSAADLKPEELAPYFHKVCKVKVLLITLGSKGVFYSTQSGQSGRVPGVKVARVVDTTAAGDTFVGYFAVMFARLLATEPALNGFDSQIEGIVKTANAAAGVCVQTKGAMQSIPFAYRLA